MSASLENPVAFPTFKFRPFPIESNYEPGCLTRTFPKLYPRPTHYVDDSDLTFRQKALIYSTLLLAYTAWFSLPLAGILYSFSRFNTIPIDDCMTQECRDSVNFFLGYRYTALALVILSPVSLLVFIPVYALERREFKYIDVR